MLSVIPKQIEDESLISYILRVTIRNGFHSPSEWLDKPTYLAITKGKLSSKQVRKLREILPLPKQSPTSKPNVRHSAIFTHTTSASPRLCPQCISGSGYLKEHWRAIGNLLCERHLTALIDVCKYCGEKLEWSTSLLTNTCSNELCCKQLPSHHLKPEVSALFIDEICDCLLADFTLSSPFETLLPHHSNPQFTDLPRTIARGLTLLTNKEALSGLIDQLTSETGTFRSLPTKYQLFPLRLLTENLEADWPIKDWVVNLNVTEKKLKVMNNDIAEFIVTIGDAVNLLSVPKSRLVATIPELASKQVIPATMRVNILQLATAVK